MLAIMCLGEDAYGVLIVDELKEQTGREVAFGSVYAALERLENKGFVSSAMGEATPERGGRAKRYFRVTSSGLKEVRQTRETLTKLWQRLPKLQRGTA